MKRILVVMTLSLLFVASFILFMHTSCSTEIIMRKVSFDSQGGSVLDAVEVIDGQKLSKPANPTKDGYSFAGWYKESNCVNEWIFSSGVVISDMTLYAKWIGPLFVGGLGPGGGYVFYDDFIGFDLDGSGSIEEDEKDLLDDTNDGILTGSRYLEAAPADFMQDSDYTYPFGYYRTLPSESASIVGTETDIGFGEPNTAALVIAMGTVAYIDYNTTNNTTENYAARLCTLYETGGYDDWFLPSKDELNLMYRNLKLHNIGNLMNTYYWSSSEETNYHAWTQSFTSGTQENNGRYLSSRIRPIRAF